MARETKIGLVVGLGFIVCFAIILSNRGTARGSSPRYGARLESEAARAPSVWNGEVGRRARPPTESARPGEREVAMSSRENARRDDDALALDARRTAEPRRGPGEHGWSRPAEVEPDDVVDGPRRRSASVDPAAPVASALDSMRERSNAVRPSPTAGDGAAASGMDSGAVGPRPSASMRRHTVAKGDTLWKIAEAHYGTKSKRIVDAIFEANRSILKDPAELVLGQELVLPEVEGAAVPIQPEFAAPAPGAKRAAEDHAKPPADAPPKPVPEKREPGKNWKWYQVKPGDRYASIAQVQLGSRERWGEIHELNKEVFPDPARIRSGVRIKLPNAN